MSTSVILRGCVENAEHGDGVTLLGGWVRLPDGVLATGGARLRLTTVEGLRLEWPLARLLPRRDLPAQGDAPAGRGFQLLVNGLADWSEGTLDVVFPGGEIPLQPTPVKPTPFRPRGYLDGGDGREAWGWLVHAPRTEAVLEMEGMGSVPVHCDIHRADLPFDDGSALPAFGFHLAFAGTALADGQGPRRLALRAAGVLLGEVAIGASGPGTGDNAAPRMRPTASTSLVSGLLAERPAASPAAAARPSLTAPPRPASPSGKAGGTAALLALDACQAVGSGHLLIAGWIEWVPDGTAPALRLSPRDPDTPDPTVILFDRPDLAGTAPSGRMRSGFLMVGARPATGGLPALRVRASGQGASFPLPGDAHGPSVEGTLQTSAWGAVFDLLSAAAAGGPAAALLAPELGPAGAFTRWLGGVPRPQPSDFKRVEAWAAPSGECGMGLVLDTPVTPATTLRLVALMPEAGQVRPLPVTHSPMLRGEALLVLHGTLLDITDPPAAPFEWLMELFHAGERRWFRVSPQALAAPRLLDALHRHAALPEGPDLADTLAWLRALLDQRLESFAVLLLAAPPLPPPGEGPPLLVLHGFDDAYAARLLAMAAPEIEARVAAVLLLGPREFTQPAAELFLQRGRIAAHGGAGLPALLGARRGTSPDPACLAILDIRDLGEALTTGGMDAALMPRLPAAALPLLARLAAVAGLPDAADAAARLARLTVQGAGDGLGFGPADGAGARLVAAHLRDLWRGVAPLFLPEAADGPR